MMRWIFLLVLIAGLLGGGYWWWQHGGAQKVAVTTSGNSSIEGVEEAPIVQPTPNAAGQATYTDQTYGFSITYPSIYKIGRVPSESGEVFILQNENGVGMQLMVSDFDEPVEQLTEARVKQDLPDMPVTNAREVTLPSGMKALAFESSGNGFTHSIEVWFVARGHLYQASANSAQIEFLQQVMGTFTL